MSEQTIVLILAVHWLADFVGQSDWMAQNKSKRLWPLLAHVLVYTAILAILGWRWAVVNGLAHLAIDAVTSRINAKLYAAKQIHWFFVSIGFDQLLHTAILVLTWTPLH